VFGTDIYKLSDTELVKFRLNNIGFIFQQYNLLPTLTAAQNAAVPLIAAGMKRAQAVERGAAVLERLGQPGARPTDRTTARDGYRRSGHGHG
jgi:putative ABC transport system ATP-binding protein